MTPPPAGTPLKGEARPHRASGEEAAAQAVAAARARLVLGRDARSAFFACLALRLSPVPDPSAGTMATDGTVLAYAPAFVLGLPADELVGVVAHEVLHCALAHPARRGARDPGRWNVACDLAVNPVLLEAGFALPGGRLVPGEGAFAQLPPGRTADEYYAALPANPAGGGGAADPGGCGGVRPPAAGDPAAAARSEADWKTAVALAGRAARGRGDLPAGLARQVGRVLRPPADWRDLLRAFVSSFARADYSWSRPARRHVWRGVYLPGLRSDALGEVVVAVDASGSVGPADLAVFAAELDALLSAYDCTAAVLYHDTEVQKVESWSPADGPFALAPVGGGGTDHRCVFDWLDRNRPSPAVVVCLTDLETRFPRTPPAAPVLWAVVGGNPADPPFGTRVAVGR